MSAIAASRVHSQTPFILLKVVLLLMPLLALAAPPAAIEPLVGGGQIGVIGNAFPQALVARVVDATGLPVAGVTVYFTVDASASIGDGGMGPAPSAYPFFEGPIDFVVVESDANGEAASPALTAGDDAGSFQIVATAWGSSEIAGHAYFPVRQVGSLAAVAISQGFTGAWYDPAQSGHGLLLEVLPGDRLLAYWFAFTPDDTQQAWFGGVGPILGNQAVVYADQGRGGRWIPSFDPTLFALDPWGTLTFTFTDCNHGHVDFYGAGNSSPWGAGSMELSRLTLPAGLSCP